MDLSYKLQTENFSIYNINQVSLSLAHISNDFIIWHAFFYIFKNIYIYIYIYISDYSSYYPTIQTQYSAAPT